MSVNIAPAPTANAMLSVYDIPARSRSLKTPVIIQRSKRPKHKISNTSLRFFFNALTFLSATPICYLHCISLSNILPEILSYDYLKRLRSVTVHTVLAITDYYPISNIRSLVQTKTSFYTNSSVDYEDRNRRE